VTGRRPGFGAGVQRLDVLAEWGKTEVAPMAHRASLPSVAARTENSSTDLRPATAFDARMARCRAPRIQN
jgi:hypothetical protein